VALVKRIVLFITSLFFIIILLIGATKGFAKDVMGLGIGTRTCSDFIFQTVEMGDDGELTEKALLTRLEYLQWANGFMTALNIRHYEKNNKFKKMNAVKRFSDLYNQIISSCNFIKEDGNHTDFSIATFVVFDSLVQEKYGDD